jgi:pimeloyl-ACP methyl ester carboxylesterase
VDAKVNSVTPEVRTAACDGVEIAYELFGRPADPPILLIHGLATQMLGWPDGLCRMLADRGHAVIRFDNRDVGLSTHFHDAPPVDVPALLRGDVSTASYRLSNMARDTTGLMDALELDSAHLVGASLGGTIAQTVAIEHPERVRTLTSIMSTTGDPAVGQPTREALAAILAPPASDREGFIARTVRAYEVVGSPGFAFDRSALEERTGKAFDRGYDPPGVMRQLAALVASGDRTERLRTVRVPTLVIHGRADPLADVSGGRATAAAIPGAELVTYEGMGHDFPEELWPDFVDRITKLVERGERERGERAERGAGPAEQRPRGVPAG